MYCDTSSVFDTFLGQFLALFTFFAFPAIQYIILKRFSKEHGKPELWYLPAFGFRLVIRNIPNKKTLSEIRYRTSVSKQIHSRPGASINTYEHEVLNEREDFFLFPGYDQILISFKISKNENGDLNFILTDKLGNKKREILFIDFNYLISDYSANIENWLNFDVKIAKRVVITTNDLTEYFNAIEKENVETKLPCNKIIDVG